MLLQRGDNTQAAIRISQHANKNISMMDSEQQRELLEGRSTVLASQMKIFHPEQLDAA